MTKSEPGDGKESVIAFSKHNTDMAKLPKSRLHRVKLTKEKETLLITLRGKALDYNSRNPILNDRKAYEIFNSLDYNFKKIGYDDSDVIAVVRVKEFDDLIDKFLKANKNGIVLNLGCGLDTRVTRIKPPRASRWLDVDYPEVISLRKKFYYNKPGYKMISSSITKAAWLNKIPKGRPAIIVAEGVLEYLSEKEVKTLIGRLIGRLQHGIMAFDVLSSFAVEFGKEDLKKQTGATHRWAVDDLKEVDRLNDKLRRVNSFSVFESKYVDKLPSKYQKVCKGIASALKSRDMMRILVYKF